MQAARLPRPELLPSTISLETPLRASGDDTRTLAGGLCDEVNLDAMLDSTLLRAELETVLSTQLPPLERDVLRMRYGLDDGVAKNMATVGHIAGLKTVNVRVAASPPNLPPQAAEPAFAAVVSTLIYGKSISLAKWLCLIPVIGGVILASVRGQLVDSGAKHL